jgi:hypothetical protein
MGAKIKIITGVFLVLGMLLLVGHPAMADPIWLEGTVTEGPSEGQFRYLGINDIKFTLSSEAVVLERTTSSNGISLQEPLDFNRIRVGQNVLILHEGIRIFKLIVVR